MVECVAKVCADAYEGGITGLVPEIIIDGFEAVNVSHHDRQTLPSKRFGNPFKSVPVGETGELVHGGLPLRGFKRDGVAQGT